MDMRASDYEILYDLPSGEYDGRRVEGVRTVTIRAGRSLEVMVHPTNRLTAEARREAQARRTRPAVAKINARNRERHIMRLFEENFSKAAYVITLTYAYPAEEYGMANLKDLVGTYEERGLPWEMWRVKADVRNYLAKLRRRVIRETGSAEGFKWLFRIEEGKESPLYGLPPKFHVHAVIEAPGVSRETMDALWDHGSTTCEHFRLNDDGAARLAKYMNKPKPRNDGRGGEGRCWSHSRNLIIPQPRVSDRKISRRRLSKIAADVRRDGKEILEGLYPGYRLVAEPEVRFSDFAAGAYIYARLRRRE